MPEEPPPKKRKRDGSTPSADKKGRKAKGEVGREELAEPTDRGPDDEALPERQPKASSWGSWIEAEQRWMGAGREVFVTPLPEIADEEWLRKELEQPLQGKRGSKATGASTPEPERVKVVRKASGIVCAFVLLATPEAAQDFITLWGGKPLGSVTALSVSLSRGNLGTASGGAKKPVCMFFLEGKCAKGESCNFAHEGKSESSSGRRLDVCKFFIEGRCSRGALCKFSHRGEMAVAAPSLPAPMHNPSIDLPQLYEDDDVLAISKPAGLACHPSSGSTACTLAHALVDRVPNEMLQQRAGQRESDSFVPRALVHRLDRGTSGAIVIAKTPLAEWKLGAVLRGARCGEVPADQFVRKTYVALLVGSAPGAVGSDVPVDAAMARNPENPKLMAVTEDGLSARSVIHVHRHHEKLGASLVTVDLHTGRMHQIRVHCAHVGAPVAGDIAYGGGGRAFRSLMLTGAKKLERKLLTEDRDKDGNRHDIRPLLHSWALELPHPAGEGQQLKLRAPLPMDITRVLRRLWPDLPLDPDAWTSANGAAKGKMPKRTKARKRPDLPLDRDAWTSANGAAKGKRPKRTKAPKRSDLPLDPNAVASASGKAKGGKVRKTRRADGAPKAARKPRARRRQGEE